MSRLSCCFALLSLVVVCCSQGNSYSLTECNAQTNFYIVENHETSMTCTGLVYYHYIHWNITGPETNGVETTVASCGSCTPSCDVVCSSSNPNYEISRSLRSTTLQFKNNLNANTGAVVKCSNEAKTLIASCNINVIKAYKLDKCVNNEVEVIEKKETTIRCSGLDASQNMYWTVTDLDGNSVDVAECGYCLASGSCNPCRIANSHFRVTRSREFSDLQSVVEDGLKNGWTLTCSKKDDATQDQCKIRVKYYHMPQCQNRTLQIWETQPQTPILCEGLKVYDNVNWMITNNNGIPDQIAFCRDVFSSYKCLKNDTDFSASRNETVGQLVMENYVRDKVVNKTLTCVRRDGGRRDSCRIRVVYPAEISRRNVTLDGWNVTATVVIDKVYDSDRDVVCLWNMTGPNSIQLVQYQRPKLSPLAEEADSPMYDHGACSVSIPVNATEGVYRLFLTVMPAGGPVAVGSVTLRKPGRLLRLPSCPQYIAEGTSLECPCRHAFSFEGSPPARATWLNYDNTSVLRVGNVRREQNGTTYTCRSVWGPNNDVTGSRDYTLLVAYQPETPEDNADVPLAFIAGGSVAAAVVIVFIVVVVVIIVKRKDRTYERPRRRRGIPEHTYSDLHPDNNTAPQPLNTAPNTSQNTADNTAHNAADNTAFNTAPDTAPDTETGRVYVNIRSDGASGGAVYYNETSDTQTAPSTDGQDADHYYSEVTDGQDADHYYSEVTDLPPVELNGPAALTRKADPGMNMSLYEEIK